MDSSTPHVLASSLSSSRLAPMSSDRPGTAPQTLSLIPNIIPNINTIPNIIPNINMIPNIIPKIAVIPDIIPSVLIPCLKMR